MHKGEGGRWAGTEVGGYRSGEVQMVARDRRREGLEGGGRF